MSASPEQVLAQFGKESFRPLQRELIECALAGHSCIGILPTGSGKSLCYQIPAVLFEGRLTVVVSPLIALMKDQVEGLARHGVRAARYDSSQSEEERARILQEALSLELSMLFVAPESLASVSLREVLGKVPLGLFVIDEAHCLSEWGHSFRPDYLALPEFEGSMEFLSVMALTATATEQVRRDLASIFGIREEHVFCLPPTRMNIARRVIAATPEDKLKIMGDLLANPEHVPAIVYAATRKDTEELAALLEGRGIRCRPYHAGMPPELRLAVQDEYLAGGIPVLVATIAFGMGIDKPDVRSVIHYHMPSSPESYVQESGRAGRDGLPSTSVVFYHPRDRQTALNRIKAARPDETAIGLLLGRLLASGENVISLYGATTECDVPEQVLNRTMFDLEREGTIRTLARGYQYYKAKPLFPLQVILSGRDEEECRSLAWLAEHPEGEIVDAAIAAGMGWKETVDWLEDLIAGGEWQVTFRQRALLIRTIDRNVSIRKKTEELVERYARQMSHDEERLDTMVRFLLDDACLGAALDHYFGFPGGDSCGICGQCAGMNAAGGLTDDQAGELPDDMFQQIAALASESRPTLARAHQMTRFLLGNISPASLRARLWNHPLYGALSGYPWDDVFAVSLAILGK